MSIGIEHCLYTHGGDYIAKFNEICTSFDDLTECYDKIHPLNFRSTVFNLWVHFLKGNEFAVMNSDRMVTHSLAQLVINIIVQKNYDLVCKSNDESEIRTVYIYCHYIVMELYNCLEMVLDERGSDFEKVGMLDGSYFELLNNEEHNEYYVIQKYMNYVIREEMCAENRFVKATSLGRLIAQIKVGELIEKNLIV